ncbi:MAG: hypothetical protein P1U63_05875 [Coxiellaceae bacterium]|nr:hypothetical protein [Coxiellaceae bacterium]
MRVYSQFAELLKTNVKKQLKPVTATTFSTYPGAPEPLDKQLQILLNDHMSLSNKNDNKSEELQLHNLMIQLASIERALSREVFQNLPTNETAQYNLMIVKQALVHLIQPHFPDINSKQSFNDIAEYFKLLALPDQNPYTKDLVDSVATEIMHEMPLAPIRDSATSYSRVTTRIAQPTTRDVSIKLTETGVIVNGNEPTHSSSDKLQTTTINNDNKVLHSMQMNWLNRRIKELTKETKNETNINARKNVKLGMLVLLKIKMQENQDPHFVLANSDVDTVAAEMAATLNQLNNADRAKQGFITKIFSSQSNLNGNDMKDKLYAGIFRNRTEKLKVLTDQGDEAIRSDNPAPAA